MRDTMSSSLHIARRDFLMLSASTAAFSSVHSANIDREISVGKGMGRHLVPTLCSE